MKQLQPHESAHSLVHLIMLLMFVFQLEGAQNARAKEDSFVSIIKLISSPESFDQQKVRVQGVCAFGFKISYVYSSLEAAKSNRFMDGVWLDTTRLPNDQINRLKKAHHSEITLVGVFSEESIAPYRWSSGTLYLEKVIYHK